MLATLFGMLMVAFVIPLWLEDEDVIDEFKIKLDAFRAAIEWLMIDQKRKLDIAMG